MQQMPSAPVTVPIIKERIPYGRYKGWFRGRISAGTFLTPEAEGELEFRCAVQDLFEAWCNGIQRNAAKLQAAPLPPYEDKLLVVLWANEDTWEIAPGYVKSRDDLRQPQPRHILGGVSEPKTLQTAALLLASWHLAWVEDTAALYAGTSMQYAAFTGDPDEPVRPLNPGRPSIH